MNLLTDRPIILASASPRRLELLRQIGVTPQVIPAVVEELSPGSETPPAVLVEKNALRKAMSVARYLGPQNALVIGADTVVAQEGTVLGKPKDPADAERMLGMLSGQWHQVFSGLCVVDGRNGRRVSGCSVTKVHFVEMTADEIAAYVATGDPLDKAGAYGMQSLAALYVDRILGDYSTVVGMSLPLLRIMVRHLTEDRLGEDRRD